MMMMMISFFIYS